MGEWTARGRRNFSSLEELRTAVGYMREWTARGRQNFSSLEELRTAVGYMREKAKQAQVRLRLIDYQ